MTILFVLENHYPYIGGVETLFKTLTEALVEKGNRVIVLTSHTDKSSPKSEVLNGVEINRLPFPNRYFFTFFSVPAILKYIKECDVVHTTSYNAGLPAFIASLVARKKVVITFHEYWGKLWFKLPYMNIIARSLFFSFEQMLVRLPFTKFIAVSESTKESLLQAGIRENKIIVNHNGVDYDQIEASVKNTVKNDLENQPFTYTFCGRLGMSKGIDILLEAASAFKEKRSDSKLKMIIPKIPAAFFEKILKEIKDRKLEQYIELKHELEKQELQRELLNSHCVVVPSYTEGFCFVAVETIALGIPIISSDKKALREVVSGKFIKMKSFDSNALVDALEDAYHGKWNESEVVKFHLDDSVNRYIRVYNDLMIQCENA